MLALSRRAHHPSVHVTVRPGVMLAVRLYRGVSPARAGGACAIPPCSPTCRCACKAPKLIYICSLKRRATELDQSRWPGPSVGHLQVGQSETLPKAELESCNGRNIGCFVIRQMGIASSPPRLERDELKPRDSKRINLISFPPHASEDAAMPRRCNAIGLDTCCAYNPFWSC